MIALILVAVILVTVFNYYRVTSGGFKALFLKTAASLWFIVAGIYSIIHNPVFPTVSETSLFFICALVMGMLGDIFLNMKWLYSADNKTFTKAGFVSFGIGHFAYIYGILKRDTPIDYLFISCIIGAVLAIVVILLEKLMKLSYGSFKVIAGLYSFILITTVSFSAFSFYKNQSTSSLLTLVGLILFLKSDLILSGIYFGKNKPQTQKVAVVINHIFYYLGQYMIAFSLMGL